MKKYSKSGTVAFTILLATSLAAFAVNIKWTNYSAREYTGKVTVLIRSNDRPIDQMLGGITLLVSNNYMLEYNTTIKSSEWDSVSQKVISYAPDDPRYFVLENYVLTDFSTGILLQFNTNLDSLKVVSSIPAVKKDLGYMPNGQTEIDIIAKVISGFAYAKDTVIDQVNYKILTYSKRESVRGSVILEKGVAYLNTEMRDFPIRISNYLDKQYSGWVNRMDLWVKDTISGQSETYSTALQFTPHLTPDEQNLIKKIIPAARVYLDTASISKNASLRKG